MAALSLELEVSQPSVARPMTNDDDDVKRTDADDNRSRNYPGELDVKTKIFDNCNFVEAPLPAKNAWGNIQPVQAVPISTNEDNSGADTPTGELNRPVYLFHTNYKLYSIFNLLQFVDL